MKKTLARISSLVLAVAMVFTLCAVAVSAGNKDIITVGVPVNYHQNDARELFKRINDHRALTQHKLGIITWGPEKNQYNYKMEQAAKQRAAEISVYYDSARPNGEKSSDGLKTLGSKYGVSISKEVRSYGQNTPEDALKAMVASDSKSLEDITMYSTAVSCVERGGVKYWVVLLGNDNSTQDPMPAVDGMETAQIDIMKTNVKDASLTSKTQNIIVPEGGSVNLPEVTGTMILTKTVPEKNSFNVVPECNWRASQPDGIASIAKDEKTGKLVVTGLKEGKTTITAFADLGEVAETATINIEVRSQVVCTSFTASPADTQQSGKAVTLTATADKGKKPYSYKFIVHNPTNDTWWKIQDFSSKNTCQWPTGNEGKKELYVDVKDAYGNVVRRQLNYTVTDNLAVTLESATGATAIPGTYDKLTAKATGGSGNNLYKFTVVNTTTGQSYTLQDWGKNSTFNWYTSIEGVKRLQVSVKDSVGDVRTADIWVNVTSPVDGLAVSTYVIQGSDLPTNSNATVVATAAGGKAPYTYTYTVINKTTGGRYDFVKDSKSREVNWYTSIAGDKSIVVTVKDANGSTATSAAYDVSVKDFKASLASSNGTYLNKNTVTKLTAAAEGGSGDFSYKFIVYNKKTNSWYKLQDFSAASTYDWYTGTAARKQLFVDIRDNKTGAVVRAGLDVIVK